jgi:hypothetical protein
MHSVIPVLVDRAVDMRDFSRPFCFFAHRQEDQKKEYVTKNELIPPNIP